MSFYGTQVGAVCNVSVLLSGSVSFVVFLFTTLLSQYFLLLFLFVLTVLSYSLFTTLIELIAFPSYKAEYACRKFLSFYISTSILLNSCFSLLRFMNSPVFGLSVI